MTTAAEAAAEEIDSKIALMRELADSAAVEMKKEAAKWSGDSATDILARGIFNSLQVQVEAITQASEKNVSKGEEPANPLIAILAIKQVDVTIKHIGALLTLGRLKS